MKISVISLGCKVNTCECESIVARLKQLGHSVSMEFCVADCYIINTCAVTQEAEKKSRQAVARVRKFNPDADIYIIGCAAQKNADQFTDRNPIYIGGNKNKEGVCDFPCGVNVVEPDRSFDNMTYSESARSRAHVKIQDGCDNFCTYCIVPYLRGRARSRSIDDVICECNLKALETSEIVLTGINLSAYGKDIGLSLVDLVKALQFTKARIRLGSLEVNVIDSKFLSAMKNAGNFCPHFHLSLQSGDDNVLKTMNRHYTSKDFLEKCELIYKFFPDAAITTDIIVGFPTETDEAFENTYELAKQARFADIHVFPYSRRSGTKAYSMKLLPSNVVDKRVTKLTELKHILKREFAQRNLGVQHEVVAEYSQAGMAEGYSENYLRTYFRVSGDVIIGKKYRILALETYKDGAIGEIRTYKGE